MTEMIWDRTTRLIHWTIAILVILNLFILEEGDLPHNWVGYAAVALVAVRFIWGFVGAPASRFSNFPLRPREVIRFLKSFRGGERPEYVGHNPLASYTYIGIWSCLLGLGVTGWMMGLDAYWGEEWLEEIHEGISIFLQVLIVLHLFGMIVDSIRYRRRTWLAMILGRR